MPRNHIFSETNCWQSFLVSFLVFCLSIIPLCVSAQEDGPGIYTREHPLVYEDALNLWPYAFKGDDGKPAGYNIDLVKQLLEELDIPYVIQLKPWGEVVSDLKSRKADLTIGLSSGFSELPVLMGEQAVEQLTQSVVTPKSQSIAIKKFRDLGKAGTKVIVRDSSFCHHLMVDYGWGNNALPTEDIREAILRVDEQQEGQIVWRSLGLKWLIHHYQLKGVTLTAVNMPYGEYKFLSKDQHLLDQLDEAFIRFTEDGRLDQLDQKWFYPVQDEPQTPVWIWVLGALSLLLLILALVYLVMVRLKDTRLTAANNRLNRRLALIIETSHVRIWTYDVARHEFAWHNEDGQVACTYTVEEFSRRYSQSDFETLKGAIDRLVNREKDAHGHESDNLTLELKAKDVEGGDHNIHDFVVALSVLSRDKEGNPTVIIGTKKDVTDARYLRKVNAERSLRFWSMFYNSESGVVLFDKDGCVSNANLEACEMFHCDIDQKVKEGTHLNDWFGTHFTNFDDIDGYADKHKVGDRTIEYKVRSVHDDHGGLLGLFAFCRYVAASFLLLFFALQASAQSLAEQYVTRSAEASPATDTSSLFLIACCLLAAVIVFVSTLLLRAHAKRLSASSNELQQIMHKALHMGDYDVMTYQIARNSFTNQYGTILPDEGLTLEGYIQRIDSSQRAEFSQKMRNMMEGRERHFELNKRWNYGTDEAPDYHYFQGHAICEFDKKGRPEYIVNAVNDVTQEMKEFLASRDLLHYYEVLLENPFVAMKFYDKKGVIIDSNEAMKVLGDVKDTKHIQPLYDAKGEIYCFFVSKALDN